MTGPRPGWRYFDESEDMDDWSDLLCPQCEGLALPVAIQHPRPRSWVEAMCDPVRLLYACEDCEREFIARGGAR